MAVRPKGFAVRCIKCGNADGIRLKANDLRRFECVECSEEYGAGEVREMVEGWAALLAWIETAPDAAR